MVTAARMQSTSVSRGTAVAPPDDMQSSGSDRATQRRATAEREQTLLELARRDTTDLRATCRAATEAAAALVGVARASVWWLADDRLVCDDLFLRDEVRHVSGQTIERSSCPAYFATVTRSMAVRASDARTDLRTRELQTSYLGPLGIGAMLDTPIWQPGAVRGVLCCEHVGGPRRWTGREERDAARMADLVARSIEAESRRAAEERARIILEAIPQYVLVVDDRGSAIVASEMIRRAMEEEPGSVLAERFENVELHDLAGSLLPRAQWPAERARRGDTVRAEIVEASSRVTGRRKWLRATSAPVMIGGSALGAVTIFEDMAEEVRIERVKREVLTAVAHELRTPATLVKGYAQRLLKLSGRSSEESRALAALERSAGRIERLIEALIDLSAITLGRIVLSLAHVDLAEVVLRAVETAPRAHTHRLRFVPGETKIRAFVDPTRVGRVIGELIDNAARCSPAGSEILVELSADAAHARVSITDHGVGIPAAVQARVFEPLFHAHAGMPNETGGLGIGLFLAREVVNRHGGSLTFVSQDGVGSTFVMTLPREEEE